MIQNRVIKQITGSFCLLFCFFLLQGCNFDSGSGSSDSPKEPTTPTTPVVQKELSVKSLDYPDSISSSTQKEITLKVTGLDEETLLYEFQSNFGQLHFKPNSGLIALKEKEGQIRAIYTAPDMQGTYSYRVVLKNSKGEMIEKPFNITVSDQ